ncbi:hypothetical protein NKJ46_18430 [Mesorhizobium sp. M0166]|uniref:hypothetical protein n=1 Tax=Mesorhizobium sp. M0166 TaxID=2956902 RepID=UPI0033354319
MDRNIRGFLYAAAFIVAAVAMFGVHWLMTGISKDFGMGITVGLFLGIGIVALASKQVRESD